MGPGRALKEPHSPFSGPRRGLEARSVEGFQSLQLQRYGFKGLGCSVFRFRVFRLEVQD